MHCRVTLSIPHATSTCLHLSCLTRANYNRAAWTFKEMLLTRPLRVSFEGVAATASRRTAAVRRTRQISALARVSPDNSGQPGLLQTSR